LSAVTAVRNALKVFFLLLLLIAIVLGGIYWFDHLGLIDYKRVIGPLVQYLPSFMQRGEAVVDDPYLLEKELLGKREEVLMAQYDELHTKASELEQKELELKEVEAKLTEENKRLEEEKKVLSEKLSEYDNYRENIAKQAEYFTSMPPNAAVERLARLDDLLVIDILRQIDRTAEEEGRLSVVPYFLSLMDPAKAAVIQRKMTKVGDIQE
jgi:flagellar protein FlbB